MKRSSRDLSPVSDIGPRRLFRPQACDSEKCQVAGYDCIENYTPSGKECIGAWNNLSLLRHGRQGSVYRCSNSDGQNFAIKFIRGVDRETLLGEASYQLAAAEAGLSPTVYQVMLVEEKGAEREGVEEKGAEGEGAEGEGVEEEGAEEKGHIGMIIMEHLTETLHSKITGLLRQLDLYDREDRDRNNIITKIEKLWDDAVNIIRTLNSKLHIRHGDAHPENFMVSDNRVYLIDFGLARDFDETEYRNDSEIMSTYWMRQIAPLVQK